MKPNSQRLITTPKGVHIKLKEFGLVDYELSHRAMKTFASERDESVTDEIWLLQHPPVYTQGTACEMATLLPSDIPVIKTDRGGQITYHGPGQWVMYPLLHLKRHSMGVRSLVGCLEQCIIDLLASEGVIALRRENAPGVYVNDEKIAALGLRIRRGNSYHGLSLNVDMDLAPFSNIDPCGYQGLKVTQLANLITVDEADLGKRLVQKFVELL